MIGHMPEVMDMVVELVTHAGKTGITHLGKRLDATLPQAPQPPVMPVFQPPVYTPPPMAAFGPPAAALAVGGPSNPPAGATPPPPSQASGESYSDQVADGVACLSCTRGHVTTASVAAGQAVKALEAGHDAEARRQWAIVAAEYDALVTYDWEAGKLAATPSRDRAIIEAVRPCVAQARSVIPTPTTVATAFGSATENERFAISTRFTERDAAEIATRHQGIDSHGNYAERVELIHDTSPGAMAAKRALREGRHVLDHAKATDTLYTAETWSSASAYFENAAVALTPAPTLEQARALAATCQACSQTFYREYFRTAGGSPS